MFLSEASALLLWTFLVLQGWTAAEPLCDPETQYLQDGECCLKCQPGTHVVSPTDCRNPVCKDCDERYYTSTYNVDPVCNPQPYCDPNSHFQWPEHLSKTQGHVCLCELGFHCSGASCSTCVPHTECGPGFGVTSVGGQTQDTVCEECPPGTFSDTKSWNGTCLVKSSCGPGYEPVSGNAQADAECVPQHWHLGLIAAAVVLVALVVLVASAAVVIHKCKDPRHKQDQLSHNNTSTDHDRADTEERGIIANPTDDVEFPSGTQETHHCGIPVETEDTHCTFQGDVLSQDGKESILSQPETQALVIY